MDIRTPFYERMERFGYGLRSLSRQDTSDPQRNRRTGIWTAAGIVLVASLSTAAAQFTDDVDPSNQPTEQLDNNTN